HFTSARGFRELLRRNLLILLALSIGQLSSLLLFGIELITAIKILAVLVGLNALAIYAVNKPRTRVKSDAVSLTRQAASGESSLEAGKTLQIACATLPFLRQGLNRLTAQKIAEIIKQISD